MSPNGQAPKIKPSNNIYTVILAVATGTVIAVAGFVLYMCLTQYETFYKMPS
ncbi:MAG: hypothetical protein ACYS8Z_08915 [Planctomycetota bacterium]|jgi:hypothetical protein